MLRRFIKKMPERRPRRAARARVKTLYITSSIVGGHGRAYSSKLTIGRRAVDGRSATLRLAIPLAVKLLDEPNHDVVSRHRSTTTGVCFHLVAQFE